MNNFWEDFLVEIALFSFLGVLYYFYQKRKIVHYEENKGPLVMGFILQSCLTEKKDIPEAELDSLIEALDDYLQNHSAHPPVSLLKHFMLSPACSEELSAIIREGLIELELHDDKK
jgi:hypothetical protein